jgi:hypothetical protein
MMKEVPINLKERSRKELLAQAKSLGIYVKGKRWKTNEELINDIEEYEKKTSKPSQPFGIAGPIREKKETVLVYSK